MLEKFGNWKKNACLHQRLRCKLENNDNNFESCCQNSCESFGLEESFQGTCFGHAMSKACQYGTIDDKVCA